MKMADKLSPLRTSTLCQSDTASNGDSFVITKSCSASSLAGTVSGSDRVSISGNAIGITIRVVGSGTVLPSSASTNKTIIKQVTARTQAK